MLQFEDKYDSEDEEIEDPDEYATLPKKVSGFYVLKKCYAFNVVQYNTILFVLNRN